MATTTPVDVFPEGVKPFAERKFPKTLCMFDVDGTLSRARIEATPETQAALKKLRGYVGMAFVGGSDLSKIREQLDGPGGNAIEKFDYGFAENGLTAYKLSKELPSNSFIKHVGEDNYKKLANWTLRYLSELDIPIKRGTFIEFRRGMINVSPIGRNATNEERADFQDYDKIHNIRSTMLEAMRKEFAHLNLTYSIGGMISFDVFPQGWDKTYALNHVEHEGFDEIHFFGDKTYKGGNDYEIYSDPRTIGHSVENPEHTLRLLDELFFSKA